MVFCPVGTPCTADEQCASGICNTTYYIVTSVCLNSTFIGYCTRDAECRPGLTCPNPYPQGSGRGDKPTVEVAGSIARVGLVGFACVTGSGNTARDFYPRLPFDRWPVLGHPCFGLDRIWCSTTAACREWRPTWLRILATCALTVRRLRKRISAISGFERP